MTKVSICEVGPRDGLQSEPELLSTEVKKEFITRSIKAGIKNIEVTSFVHPKKVPQMADAGSWLHPCLNKMTSHTLGLL